MRANQSLMMVSNLRCLGRDNRSGPMTGLMSPSSVSAPSPAAWCLECRNIGIKNRIELSLLSLSWCNNIEGALPSFF